MYLPPNNGNSFRLSGLILKTEFPKESALHSFILLLKIQQQQQDIKFILFREEIWELLKNCQWNLH